MVGQADIYDLGFAVWREQRRQCGHDDEANNENKPNHGSLVLGQPAPGVCPQAALARHRLVYAALGDMMQTDIHALSIRAQTPQEADEES